MWNIALGNLPTLKFRSHIYSWKILDCLPRNTCVYIFATENLHLSFYPLVRLVVSLEQLNLLIIKLAPEVCF